MTRKSPLMIDIDAAPEVSPAEAPPIQDQAAPATGLQTVATLAARKPNSLARFFWASVAAFLSFAMSLALWNWVSGLLAANPVLGLVASVLLGLVLLALLAVAGREVMALRRLGRIDKVQKHAKAALLDEDLSQAQGAVDAVIKLYSGREDAKWGLDRLRIQRDEIFDASGLIGAAETEVLVPLDAQAMTEVESAARQVAAVTALVPLALADVVTALTSNLRMIRRIAEVYGGRSGTLESFRLARIVFAHLVATGAVAIGDDVIGSVAGGSVLSKLSRRFGEGIINGALTARVGVAAIEVCRPLPRVTTKPPSVTGIVGRAVTGVFSRGG